MWIFRCIVTCHIKLPPKISGGFRLQLQSGCLVEVVWCLDANANPGTCADSTSCPLRRRRNENIIFRVNGGAISMRPAWIFSYLTHQASFEVYSEELKSGAEDLGKGCLQVDNNATIVSISEVREPAHMWWYTKKNTDNRKSLDWWCWRTYNRGEMHRASHPALPPKLRFMCTNLCYPPASPHPKKKKKVSPSKGDE